MRVLELSENLTGAFAAMLLAETGAEVIKVEAPGGDPWRRKTLDQGDDSTFVYANRRKRSALIDITTMVGRKAFRGMAANADVIIEDLGAGELARRRLSYRSLKRGNRDLVVVSIAPFGQDGPHAGWQASDLVLHAMGGILHNTGWDGEPPLKLAGYPVAFVAAINAATAALAAVYGVEEGNESGVHIDLSMQEAFAHHWSRHIAQWSYSGTATRRESRGYGRQAFEDTVMAGDDWLYLLALNASWDEVAAFMGLEQFLTPEYSDARKRTERWPEMRPVFHAKVASKGRYQWFAEAAEAGFTFAPIDDPQAILDSPQMASRGYFKPAEVDGRTVPVPGLPFAFDGGELAANRAPALGEHTTEVLRQVAGMSDQEIGQLRRLGVIGGEA